jgi:hypothetical protein
MSLKGQVARVERIRALARARTDESWQMRDTLRHWKQDRLGSFKVMAVFFAAGALLGISRGGSPDRPHRTGKTTSLLGASSLLAWKALQVPLAATLREATRKSPDGLEN